MDTRTPTPPDHASPESTGYRAPVLAGLLSIVPGLGNVYNGLYRRGIAFFFLCTGLFFLAVEAGQETGGGPELALLVPTMVFFWMFNLFDAFRQATLINHGGVSDVGLLDPSAGRRGNGGLTLGIAIALVGLYGLLDRFFDVDLTVLFEHWYFFFLAFGGWLILQALRSRAADDPAPAVVDPRSESGLPAIPTATDTTGSGADDPVEAADAEEPSRDHD